MPQRTLIISDLHLQAERPDLTAALFEFLAHNRGHADQLFILGDLFELWIGDDLDSALADSVATHLQEFAAAGTEVFLMHGNRDFLIGEDFAARCAATLIHEPFPLNTPDGPITLLHGDVLCTDDVEYQQFRALVRSQQWQQEFLSKSVPERVAFAKQARAQSRESTASKSSVIMDVNETAVREFMSANDVRVILHGHTHRPAIHEYNGTEAGTNMRRVVLGDWDVKGWYAEITAAGISLENFSIKTQ